MAVVLLHRCGNLRGNSGDWGDGRHPRRSLGNIYQPFRRIGVMYTLGSPDSAAETENGGVTTAWRGLTFALRKNGLRSLIQPQDRPNC